MTFDECKRELRSMISRAERHMDQATREYRLAMSYAQEAIQEAERLAGRPEALPDAAQWAVTDKDAAEGG